MAVRVQCRAMTCPYDLHAHSTASDGTLAPAELMRKAAEAGVRVMALTDHDTVDGLAEAEAESARLGLEFVPGIELSISWNGATVHIVGLGLDRNSQPLNQGLQGLRDFRDWRAEEIGRRLAKARIADAYEGAKAFSNGKLISRTHFARFLVQAGHADSVGGVFKKFLVQGKPGYVPGDWASLEQALGWIRDAGGQAVIAHPARYKMTRSKLRRLIGEFQELGGEALEVVSGSHTRDEYFTMANHANNFHLLSSAGSDYHGPENPWIQLGKLPDLPDICRPVWQGWALAA